MRLRSRSDDSLRCSFCRKAQEPANPLISNPGDYPRAYICKECIAVCASILAEDGDREAAAPDPAEPHALLDHPLASELIECLVLWVRVESLGSDASAELARVREVARRMAAPGA
jgi:ATP-dependent Clp protease ATP-binding subunit ClpX